MSYFITQKHGKRFKIVHVPPLGRRDPQFGNVWFRYVALEFERGRLDDRKQYVSLKRFTSTDGVQKCVLAAANKKRRTDVLCYIYHTCAPRVERNIIFRRPRRTRFRQTRGSNESEGTVVET